VKRKEGGAVWAAELRRLRTAGNRRQRRFMPLQPVLAAFLVIAFHIASEHSLFFCCSWRATGQATTGTAAATRRAAGQRFGQEEERGRACPIIYRCAVHYNFYISLRCFASLLPSPTCNMTTLQREGINLYL
jgi:hypothetical protein